MPRKRETNLEMRMLSRTALLNAARRLFAELGYEKCTVSEIARTAGMSQGNVYWYFTGKEDLLKAVLADGFETLQLMMSKAASSSGSALEKLQVLLDEFLLFGEERGDFTRIFLTQLAHGGVGRLQTLGFDTEQIGMRYHQHLTKILLQGQGEGVILEVDVGVLTMFFFAFFNGLMITYSKDWMEMPIELIRQAVLRLLGSRTAAYT